MGEDRLSNMEGIGTVLIKMFNGMVWELKKVSFVLAQRPITLILMMINSCSYSTNDIVFIDFRFSIMILVGV